MSNHRLCRNYSKYRTKNGWIQNSATSLDGRRGCVRTWRRRQNHKSGFPILAQQGGKVHADATALKFCRRKKLLILKNHPDTASKAFTFPSMRRQTTSSHGWGTRSCPVRSFHPVLTHSLNPNALERAVRQG